MAIKFINIFLRTVHLGRIMFLYLKLTAQMNITEEQVGSHL